jgi:two-component system, NarL family, nitrate/nitrite response regulator NarL
MSGLDGEVLPITTVQSRSLMENSSRGSKTMSEREKEVLALVAEGCTNNEIAVRLSIARGTVRVHLHHIFKKLRVRRRTEAAVKYLIATGAFRRGHEPQSSL